MVDINRLLHSHCLQFVLCKETVKQSDYSALRILTSPISTSHNLSISNLYICLKKTFNSLRLSDAHMSVNYAIIGSYNVLLQGLYGQYGPRCPLSGKGHSLTCRLSGAKPLPEPMLMFCKSNPWQEILMKFDWKQWFPFIEIDLTIFFTILWPFCPDHNVLINSSAEAIGIFLCCSY